MRVREIRVYQVQGHATVSIAVYLHLPERREEGGFTDRDLEEELRERELASPIAFSRPFLASSCSSYINSKSPTRFFWFQ